MPKTKSGLRNKLLKDITELLRQWNLEDSPLDFSQQLRSNGTWKILETGELCSRLSVADFSQGVSTNSRYRQETKSLCFPH